MSSQAAASIPLASLPMYDVPALKAASYRFWALIQINLNSRQPPREVLQATLGVADDVQATWLNPALLFSQTCGFPYVSELRDHVTLVGTPDYGIVTDKPGWYLSRVIVRADDTREALADYAGSRFAFNALDSQSGCHAMMYSLHTAVGDERFFDSCIETGAHAASVMAVLEGRADIAAIDAVTWDLITRYSDHAASVRVLCDTSPTPGLPYITAKSNDAAEFARATEQAIEMLSGEDRAALGLKGLWHSTHVDYDLIIERAQLAEALLKAHGLRLPDSIAAR